MAKKNSDNVETTGAAGAGAAKPYVVLARKYRPQSFEDLIGQEAMVRTLRNAFSSGRIAQAYNAHRRARCGQERRRRASWPGR